MEEATFTIASGSDIGTLSIANEGVLEFNDQSISSETGAKNLNRIYSGLSQILSNFDLTNKEDRKVANKYLSKNIQKIVSDITNNLDLEDY